MNRRPTCEVLCLKRHVLAPLLALAILFPLGGCSSWASWLGDGATRQGTSSSLVDFLYPKGEEPPPVDDVVPTLAIPLRVGLAFVPPSHPSVEELPEARKVELLERVKAAFQGEDYLREIVVIPETYLRSGRGFDTVDQVARLYGLDAIALVSYDQVSMSSDRTSAVLYWTIVGAYLIEGTENEVRTFVDTAVFDTATRKLLLRAPGTDRLERDATLAQSPQQLRRMRDDSFTRAMDQMTTNLQQELVSFRERIKSEGVVKVVQRNGQGGAGATGQLEVLVLAMLLGSVACLRRRARGRAAKPTSPNAHACS